MSYAKISSSEIKCFLCTCGHAVVRVYCTEREDWMCQMKKNNQNPKSQTGGSVPWPRYGFLGEAGSWLYACAVYACALGMRMARRPG